MTKAREDELFNLISNAKPGGIIPCEKEEFSYINGLILYFTDEISWDITDNWNDTYGRTN